MPPKIVSDVAVRIEPGSQVQCSATGTPPIYIVLIRNVTVLMNTTNTASSKLYQEGNYTCVATSKYGTDVKHFVIKGGEKIGCFETRPMYTHLSRQEKMRGQRGRLPVQALGYVNSTKVIFGLPKTAGVRFRLSHYI